MTPRFRPFQASAQGDSDRARLYLILHSTARRHDGILSKQLMPELRRRPTGRTGCAADDPLFVGPTGKRLEYANFRNRVFSPAVKAAGLTGVSPHDLRRTHATMLVSLGHNVKAVQERMGHASIQTTLTHYASATAHDLKATASAKATYMAQGGDFSSADCAS